MWVLFQSTRPLRGATKLAAIVAGDRLISIHAPLAGRDRSCWTPAAQSWHFNPRAPCGARPPAPGMSCTQHNFNPRAPCGARLKGQKKVIGRYLFQSTRPLRGATAKVYSFSCSLLLKTDKKLWFPAESAVCWGGFSRFWGKFAIKTRCEPPRKSLITWGSHAAVFGVRPSAFPPADRSGGSRSARSCSRSFSPENKSEDYRARGP